MLWSAHGVLIFCQYLSFPFLPHLAARREGAFILQFGPNQVWIELTAVRQSLPALRLQICNLCRRLLGIFSSNINTGIVSYKYIKCQCWLGSRYWLQPPGLDRPTRFEREKKSIYQSIFSFGSTKVSSREVCLVSASEAISHDWNIHGEGSHRLGPLASRLPACLMESMIAPIPIKRRKGPGAAVKRALAGVR